MVGLIGALSILLAAAGLTKLAAPPSTVTALRLTELPGARALSSPFVVRLFGVAEIGVAGYVVFVGGAPAALLLLVVYSLLGLVSWRLVRRAPGRDCGCFGRAAEPISSWHVAVNAAAAAVALAAVIWPQPSLISAVSTAGLLGVPLVISVGLLAWLSFLMMTTLPELLALNAKVVAES